MCFVVLSVLEHYNFHSLRCGVCLTLRWCCRGLSIVSAAACLARLGFSLWPAAISLCHLFHTAVLKSMVASIWSWIGGYLLAFCGIPHYLSSPPSSTSSPCCNTTISTPCRPISLTLFLPIMIRWWSSEISYWNLGIWHECCLFSVILYYYFACSLLFWGSLLSFWILPSL